MNRFLLVSMLLSIAACATPDAEPDRTESAQVVTAGDQELLTQSGQAQDADNAPQSAASAENQGELENLEDIEAPDVRETPAAMIPRKVAAPSLSKNRSGRALSALIQSVCVTR